MKVLILSMTCGEGHNSIGRAVMKQCGEYGFECRIADIYDSKPFMKKVYGDGYLFLCRVAPRFYNRMWHGFKRRKPEDRYKRGIQLQIKSIQPAVLKEIQDYAPDCIVCTHYYASAIVNNLLRDGHINHRAYALLLDFLPHPFWECSILMNAVFTPNDMSREYLVSRGFRDDQIVATGLPVNPKFDIRPDKAAARQTLELPDRFTALIISGGGGLGVTPKFLKALCRTEKPFQVLCVCGRNKRMKRRIDRMLKRQKRDNVLTFGFADNIEVMMAAADCVFSRGGGTGLTESINSGLPIIVRENMMMNEAENRDLLLSHNAALALKKRADAAKALEQLIDSPDLCRTLVENTKPFSQARAAERIMEYIINDMK